MFEVLEVTLQLLRHFRWEYQRKENPVDVNGNHPRVYFFAKSRGLTLDFFLKQMIRVERYLEKQKREQI